MLRYQLCALQFNRIWWGGREGVGDFTPADVECGCGHTAAMQVRGSKRLDVIGKGDGRGQNRSEG